jgi:phage shock protein B
VRVFLGIVLLVVCILLVGIVALHYFGGYSQPLVLFPDAHHSIISPYEIHTVQRSFVSLFALIGLGLLVLLLGGLGLVLLRSGGGPKRAKGLNGEETRIVQEIHEGLSRMEKRVEALETILLERSRNQEV